MWSVPEARRLGTLPGSERTSRTDIDARLINLWQRLWRRIPDPAAPGGWVNDDSAVGLCERLAEGRLRAGALSPDGSQVVYAIDDALYLASVAEPAAPTLLGRAPSAVEIVEFNPEGDRLATAHTDGVLRLWSLHDGTAEPLREWPRDLDGLCGDLGFDPSGALLAAAFDNGTGGGAGGGRAARRRPAAAVATRKTDDPPGVSPRRPVAGDGQPGAGLPVAPRRAGHPTVLRGHSGPVDELAFAPDGSWLASIGVDGTVRRWPLRFTRGALPSVLDDWGHTFEGGMGSIAMSPDGRFVVATASESTARVVPVDGSPPQTAGGLRPARVERGGGSRRATGRGPGAHRGQDGGPGVGPRDRRHQRPRPRGPARLARFPRLRRVRWRRPAAGRAPGPADAGGPGDRSAGDAGRATSAGSRSVGGARWSCRGAQSESRPMTATVHDLVAGTHTPLPRHGPGVSCVALDPSGTIAVTGSWDGVVRVGPVTGEEPHWLVGHESMVRTVAVSPDGRLIASGGRDGTIRLWPMPDLTQAPTPRPAPRRAHRPLEVPDQPAGRARPRRPRKLRGQGRPLPGLAHRPRVVSASAAATRPPPDCNIFRTFSA